MNSVFQLVCPLCGAPLAADGKQCVCPQKHSFDFARQGYLHLLPVQQKHSLHPGDTKEMLMARRRFLDKGYYEPIGQQVADAICRYAPSKAPVIADIGCGEGYYTAMLRQRCHASCIGIDIAKDGVRMACSRDKSILWLVAMVALLLVEAAVPGLVSIWFAIGALAALISALFHAPVWLQLVWFLAVSILALVLTRPFVKKYVNSRTTPTNADMGIGKDAVVTERIDNLHGNGAVLLEGKTWTARMADETQTAEKGETVRVLRIEGVKLIVERAVKDT